MKSKKGNEGIPLSVVISIVIARLIMVVGFVIGSTTRPPNGATPAEIAEFYARGGRFVSEIIAHNPGRISMPKDGSTPYQVAERAAKQSLLRGGS